MKMRMALLPLLTICCVALTALPATGQPFSFSTGGPSLTYLNPAPFPTPFRNVAASYDCTFADCDVTTVDIWMTTFPGDVSQGFPNPGALTWRLGTSPFSGSSGSGNTNSFTNLGCAAGAVSNAICDFQFSLGSSVDVPAGLNWITISGVSSASGPGQTLQWSSTAVPAASSTEICDSPACVATPLDGSRAFTISGTATVVPEPGSILTLGSGILGLAGVLRRKLMR